MDRATQDALVDGLTEIDRLVDELDAPGEAKEHATKLYRKAVQSDDDPLQGRGIKTVVAACVLLGSRQSNSPKTAREVADVAHEYTNVTILNRASRDLRDTLDIGILLADPRKYVNRISDDLNAPDKQRTLTHDMIDVLLEHPVSSGVAANSLAGSAFYVAGLLPGSETTKYTQEEISRSADVSTVTIRHRYPEVGKALAEIDAFEHEIPQSVVTDARAFNKGDT